MSGRPASIEVGMSVAALMRSDELTDRMRTLPARARSRICAVALAEKVFLAHWNDSLTEAIDPIGR